MNTIRRLSSKIPWSYYGFVKERLGDKAVIILLAISGIYLNNLNRCQEVKVI